MLGQAGTDADGAAVLRVLEGGGCLLSAAKRRDGRDWGLRTCLEWAIYVRVLTIVLG